MKNTKLLKSTMYMTISILGLMIIGGMIRALTRTQLKMLGKDQVIPHPSPIPLIQIGSKLQSEQIASHSLSLEQHVKDEVKGGVYTNYTYGFRFEFDDGVFDTHNPWDKYWKRFFVDRIYGSSELRVIITNSNYYDTLYSLCTVESNNNPIFKRCEESPDKRYANSLAGDQGSPYFGVAFKRSIEGPFVVIQLLYPEPQTASRDKATFDKVVNSFVFLK